VKIKHSNQAISNSIPSCLTRSIAAGSLLELNILICVGGSCINARLDEQGIIERGQTFRPKLPDDVGGVCIAVGQETNISARLSGKASTLTGVYLIPTNKVYVRVREVEVGDLLDSGCLERHLGLSVRYGRRRSE
jgi:hypothetical protein